MSINDSVVTCNENIDAIETKPGTTNFNAENIICKTKGFYIFLSIY